MRRGPGKKEASHEKIRASAAAALRRDGLDALSVHRVMRAAGLTVGGFYAHYRSRSELAVDAFGKAAAERRGHVRRALDGKEGHERLEAFLTAYLAPEHQADLASGCPWAAVLSDLQRADEPLRREATRQLERSVEGLHADRRASIATLALSFASLILMRSVTDDRLREEIAGAARFAVESLRDMT